MNQLATVLKKHKGQFASIVPFNVGADKLLQLDLSLNNQALTPALVKDTAAFTFYIQQQLKEAGALYGIGGYDEHRNVYERSEVFSQQDEEPRRLHLGIDIWGEPYTPVFAPLDAVVHSIGFNNNFGDYGGTVILSHQLEGITFFTLYGHLSHQSLRILKAGDLMVKGKQFSEFGMPIENGNWPPHLHFQIIIDIGDYKGDYPGVCKYSEKEKWLSNGVNPVFMHNLSHFIEKKDM